jgi:hypothetical protein
MSKFSPEVNNGLTAAQTPEETKPMPKAFTLTRTPKKKKVIHDLEMLIISCTNTPKRKL